MCNPPDLTVYLLAEFRKLVPRLRAVEKESWCPVFEVETIIGRLVITPLDDFLGCRFEDVEKAVKQLRAHDCGGRLNPYSGKWNWHWFENTVWPRKVTKKNMTDGVGSMLAAFAKEVEALLPPSSQNSELLQTNGFDGDLQVLDRTTSSG